jgi:hypothetical protein
MNEFKIEIDTSEYEKALKDLDTVLASMIKTEERKQRMLRKRLFNLNYYMKNLFEDYLQDVHADGYMQAAMTICLTISVIGYVTSTVRSF